MENKAHALAAGLFVIVVSALLVALAVWLTRDTGTQRAYDISTAEGVNGLQSQAAVRYRGVPVGKVTNIGFDPKQMGNVLVRIAVDDAAPVSHATFATLGFQGVTGLAFVQLDDGEGSREPLLTDSAAPARIPMRSSLLSRLSDQGVSLLARVEETSVRVSALLAPENQRKLMATVEDIGATARSARELTERMRKLSANVDAVIAAQLGPDRVSIPRFVNDASTALMTLQKTAQGIDRTATEFSTTATAFATTASEVTRLSQRLNAPGGLVDRASESAGALTAAGNAVSTGTLPRLNRTAEDASRTARQLTRAVNAVSDNPQSLIFGQGLAQPGPGEPGFVIPKGAQ